MSDPPHQSDEDGRLTKLRAAANQSDGGWYLALRDFTAASSDPAKPVHLRGAPLLWQRIDQWLKTI